MSKPIVIYHANCADGFSAAWVFWHKYKDALEYFPGIYGKPPPNVQNRIVYIVDFSYTLDVMIEIIKDAIQVTLLDHHQTAMQALDGLHANNYFPHFDINRSGASIAWDFVFPHEKRPLLLNHVEDRDLWRFKLDGTREYSAALFSHKYDFETWEKLMAMDEIAMVDFRIAGMHIERKHFKDIEELLKVGTREIVIDKILVPCCNLPCTMCSDGGDILSKSAPFAATYYDTATYRVFSLRSQKEGGMDVARIAEKYGGGGHKNAAGFRVKRDTFLAQI
jgi:oligoribonuclease NrnB/cAMP/cGMP phosphodiesterase (DHH superfamily)